MKNVKNQSMASPAGLAGSQSLARVAEGTEWLWAGSNTWWQRVQQWDAHLKHCAKSNSILRNWLSTTWIFISSGRGCMYRSATQIYLDNEGKVWERTAGGWSQLWLDPKHEWAVRSPINGSWSPLWTAAWTAKSA